MYLGIDVGGTHTDGVAVNDDFEIVRSAKVPTADNIMESLTRVLAEIMAGADPASARRLSVSSTLGLNAVLTGRADPVGVLCTGGPGLSLRSRLGENPLLAHLGGALDHRGEALSPFSPDEAGRETRRLLKAGAKALAVVSKFGPKNQAFEEEMAGAAQKIAPGLPLTRASQLAGRLNFPRRLNTAVLNSATLRLYEKFLAELSAAAQSMGLACPISLLSSEGGAMSIDEARRAPAMILAAGPAAGILGLWSRAGLSGDALMLDIGGTSADLAVMADGRPLMTAEGLDIAGKPTLVRAFLSHSIALGGDSALSWADGAAQVGPEREGFPLALRPDEAPGRRPTLTDALNVLGLCEVGDSRLSFQALERVGGGSPEALAQAALDAALDMIEEAAEKLLAHVNNRPVYTVDAVRLARVVAPAKAALLGGPAPALAAPLARRLGLSVSVPPEADVANAVGAALAKVAVSAELYADTARGQLSVPAFGLSRAIDRSYNVQKAEAELLGLLAEKFPSEKAVVTQSQSFHQLVSYGRSDKIIRVEAQLAPGALSCGKQ